ncbi:hypothetical protein [Alteribacillus iranensis]|uniref:Uncharacterized protein n=1 Tax=Alteribacillus iranensis TaxID=930128 RepID=A0A1I1ZPQ6_9BACI|nr:hypothetical protein [Alteribacillus iranensis]SFE33318.1 hypothetical protein SAMN05192532_101354 [Alteribacillus iranensis]
MDLTVFLIGAAFFTGGFFLLLLYLWRKKNMVLPFTLMGIGVIVCFIGLIMSSPLTEEERSAERIEAENAVSPREL